MPLRRSCVDCDLKGPHCFCSLDTVALSRLDQLGTTLRLPANERVLREGFASDRVYVVCRGTLKLTTSSREGRLLLLRIAGPGDILGLTSAMRRTKYEATAETLEECELKSIPRTQFLLFMEEFQAVSRNSAMAMANEYESAVLTARRLALSGSAAAKLASVLVDWGTLVRSVDPEPVSAVRFRMPLTHEELGHMAGISRETVTRVLSTFKRDGLVNMEDGWMVLTAPQDLAALAG